MKSNFARHTENYATIIKNRWCILYRKIKVKFALEEITKTQGGVEV
jgi:hypothetical protein